MIYEPCGPGGILWETVSSVTRLVDRLGESIGSSAAEVAYQEILGLLAAVYPVVKNEGFGEEAEWRAIFGNLAAGGYLAPLRFRPSGLGIAPFVPLRWKTDARLPPLAEVVMGPRIPYEEGSGALYMLLLATGHSAGCGEVKPRLSHSAVSYRR